MSKSVDGWLPIPAKIDDLKPPYDGEEYILARFIWWNGKDDRGERHGPAQWIFDWASDANWLSTSVHAHWNLDYPSEHRLVTAPPTHYREIGLPGTKRAAVRAVRRRRATRDDDIPF